MWYVHMLSPQRYERDCLVVVNTPVDHRLMARGERRVAQVEAKRIWQTCFPREPFDIDLHSPPPSVPRYFSQITYDLRAAAVRQSSFYYQVSLPHYRDTKFLSKALERYGVLLKLKRLHPEKFLVPSYDFDLIWHAHQAHPLAYKNDTVALLGRVLNHDDTSVDRSPTSKLAVADQETESLWAQYNLQYKIPGSLYRGEPPAPAPPTPGGHYFNLAVKKYNIGLLSLSIRNLKPSKTCRVKFYVENSAWVLFQRKVKGSYTSECTEPLCCFRFNTGSNSGLRIEIVQCGVFCKNKEIVNQLLDITDYITGAVVKTFGSEPFVHSFELQRGIKLEFSTRILDPPEVVGYTFAVIPQKKAEIKQLRHPAHILGAPKLFLSPRALEKPLVSCEMLLHKVTNNLDVQSFFCRVVHAAQLKLSVVEIIDNYGNVVATSHLIDGESLPQEVQLDNKRQSCSYEPTCGERAMLVRGRHDWGIVLGRWLYFKRNTFGGDPGYLQLGCYSIERDKGYMEVKRSSNSLVYSIGLPQKGNTLPSGFIHVDLATGRVTVPRECENVPEALALGVSVGVLFVLCQPYVPQDSSMPSAPALSKARLTSRPRGFINDKLKMVVAAGFYSKAVPTNTFCYYGLDETRGKTEDFCDASVCVSGCGGCATGGGGRCVSIGETGSVNKVRGSK